MLEFDALDPTIQVTIVMSGDDPDLVGLILRPDTHAIVGAVPGTSASKLTLDELAKRTGYPVDWMTVDKLRLGAESAAAFGSAKPTPLDAGFGERALRRLRRHES